MGNTCADFTKDCAYLALGSSFGRNGGVALWDVKNMKLARPIGNHDSSVRALSINPDGTLIVSGDEKGILKFRDAKKSVEIRSINAHIESVMTVEFSPDGTYVASASVDGTVKLWGPGSGKLLKSLDVQPGGVSDMAISPDGNVIAAVGAGGIKCFWNIKTGQTATVVHFGIEACVIDDRNRVDCTPGAEKYFQVMAGLKMLDRKANWKKYYTPGLLGKIMSGK